MEALDQFSRLDNSTMGHAERLITLKEAAKVLGAMYWQIQRAVKRGSIPSYTPIILVAWSNYLKLLPISTLVVRGGV